MFQLALKILIVYVLSTVAYYLWLIGKSYRVFKFACAQNGGFIPLIPFVGNAYISILTGLRVNLLSTSLFAEKFIGIPFSFWFGDEYNYVSNSAEDAKIVLNHSKCLNKAHVYADIQYLFGNSILLIPAEPWKIRRRYLRSAYTTGMINQFVSNLYQQSCFLLERIKTKRAEEDHFRFFNTHAFMSFFFTSIGWVEEDIQDSEVIEFAHLIDKVQDEFIKLLVNPVIPTYLWIRTPLGAKLRLYTRETKRILTNILIKKKAQMDELAEFVDKKSDLSLVELLLNNEYDASGESNVYEEFMLFSGAATDTTGHSLVFAFTLLGIHQEIQQKLYDEVISVLGDKEIDGLDLPKLIYTEAVISETMRILPSVPLVGRYCSADITLGDKILPKGANIFISIFHIHRNPDFWEDPLKFDPNRFLPENLHKIVPGAYLPFSSGPRNCIGQRLAQVLMMITVANVIRNFKISSNHKSVKEFKLTSCISMKTRNHLDLHFEPRKSYTVAYYLWVFGKSYRVSKFACSQHGGLISLIPFAGNAYISFLTGLRINLLSTSLLAERFFGLPFSFWFGDKYNYVTNSAEDAKIVLNHSKCLNKAKTYTGVQYIFGNSILLIPAEPWKIRRRYIRSAFATGMINQFVPTLYQQSCLLLERIKQKRPEGDNYKFFNTHAFMSFFLTSIGWVEEDIQDSEVIEFAHLIEKVQDEFIKLLANPVEPIYLWLRTPLGAKLRVYNREMRRILKNILIKKKAQMDKLAEFVDKKSDLTLVELLLNDEYDAKGEANVYEEFTFFSAAATNTTGHSLVFAFTLLGMHPEIQQKLYDEVISVLGDKEIDSLDLPKLIYTEAVISETMRILPSVPFVGRYCSADINLGDKILPEGASTFISIFHIHRNPDIWEDPLKFNPDRFLPENLHKIVPGSYLPFSTGPRNCIGLKMVQDLMKITVANVIRNFRISSNHKSVKEFKLTSCITMKTRNHLDLHFEPRKS